MPGPAGKSAHGADVATKQGKVDIGKQLGQYDTATVRHRVRQWQADGGGVVVPGGVTVAENEGEAVKDNTKTRSRRETPIKDDKTAAPDGGIDPRRLSPTKSPKLPGKHHIDSEPQPWLRRKSKPTQEPDDESNPAESPKRRVISDGHWRKDRTPPKKEDQVLPKQYHIKRTVVYTQNEPPSKKYRDDDGIRVRPLKHVFHNRANTPDPTRNHNLNKSVTTDRNNHKPDTTDQTPPTSSRKTSDKHKSSPERDTDRSLHDYNSPSAHTPTRRHAKPASPASKAKATSPIQPQALPKTHANRIQAWLSATPEDTENEDEDVFLTPPKSRKTSNESSSSNRDTTPNKHRKAPAHRPKPLPRLDEDATATEVRQTDKAFPRHSPDLSARRQFPSTGMRLSTIASVDTFDYTTDSPAPSVVSEQPTVIPEKSPRTSNSAGLKRRLTKHEDLMSVLSLPTMESASKVSKRTTSHIRRDNLTVRDLWDELAADEAKYQQELRTVVDGVIPVLLSCVLSKADASVAAGLFGRPAPAETVTKPIVDMGIALERLKAHHKRVPTKDEGTLYVWALGATRIYADYLRAWRMGFQDVVVNLAPGNENRPPGWDDGLLRNDAGDLVNTDGERVDVAFLLKRPLVRLKNLAKTFRGFSQLKESPTASSVAEKYQNLVVEARKRSNEERARLEDEAASCIDPQRVRDPRSLAPLTGVTIDPTRCVHARDYFDMELKHSSGQQIDCKIEMILRNDERARGNSGDVLICEVSDIGRWLLFPPIRLEFVSARNGRAAGELVVMIRGQQVSGLEWQELLSLKANEDDAAPEWVAMLGLVPVPPTLDRAFSFLTPAPRIADAKSPANGVQKGLQSTSYSPSDLDIPIGEVASSASRVWDDETSTILSDHLQEEPSSPVIGTIRRKPVPRSRSGETTTTATSSSLRDLFSSIDSALSDASSHRDISGPSLQRSTAKKYRQSPVSPPGSPSLETLPRDEYVERPAPLNMSRPAHSRTQSEVTTSTYMSGETSSTISVGRKKSYKVWLPSSTMPSDDSEGEEEDDDNLESRTSRRLKSRRRTSSVPSGGLAGVSEPRSSRSSTPSNEDKYKKTLLEPSSAPGKLQKSKKSVSIEVPSRSGPDHSTSQPSPKPKFFSIPTFTPAFLKRRKRPSSPLKHQYEPSVISDSSSVYSLDDDDDASITSESSDEGFELAPPITAEDGNQKSTPPASEPSLPSNTPAPSQSASQAPYRAVPQPNIGAQRTVASIFSWADSGVWEPLHPQECSIIVTAGLIEVFALDSIPPTSSDGKDSSSATTRGSKPLVAFEVTPLVPLRRGTALDISIRSPPTENSIIRSSSNVMLRSRSPEECELLYSLINQARINNPTYIALQNARGPFNENTWAAAMDRRNSGRRPKNSWWNLPSRKSSTYRSKGTRSQSAATESSVGTSNSAFSAMKRFSTGNNFFDIARSKITSKDGSLATSESMSSDSSTPILIDPSLGTPLGITNAKIHLYARETQTKWRDMGTARLTIMLPSRPASNTPPSPRSMGSEKRIIVHGKTRGETLLDVTLGESSFERVARTGIAVSVWEDNMGPNGELGQAAASGGVMGSKVKTYIIQMKSERDCTYTFGLVGKFRY